jgi:hypothetical protein
MHILKHQTSNEITKSVERYDSWDEAELAFHCSGESYMAHLYEEDEFGGEEYLTTFYRSI